MAYHLFVLVPFTVILISSVWGFIYRRLAGSCTSRNQLHGKTIIITGASAGIGKTAALDLAKRGARVILACRNIQKAEKVRQEIIRAIKRADVVVKQIDTSDLKSVRKFSKHILATETRLDILINNAGAGYTKRELSPQGHELTLATNHYGHFLLTSMLLGLLKKSDSGRIINVSSISHQHFYLDVDDLHFKKRSYGYYKAYAQSKLCNVLFTNHLSKLLSGTGVTVNSLHPGVVSTEIISKDGSIMGKIASAFIKWISKDATSGAQTTIYLAVADEVKHITGKYFVDCQIASTSKKAKDSKLAKKLWEITEEETRITKEEINY